MILIADISGERLDAFLARSVENLTRSSAQRLLEEGCVLRCGNISIMPLMNQRTNMELYRKLNAELN